jgi:dTDP-4-dehydrorhamnose 3,5-epimerase-like enzyme
MCPDDDRARSLGDGNDLSVDLAVYELPNVVDSRGSLTFCEFAQHLPFEPRRLFYITGVPEGVGRGGHAHRECHQLWVCLQGSMQLEVFNGTGRASYRLDDPCRGYFVPAGVWTDLTAFEPGTVLLCLASHPYDPSDYIRDRDEYLDWTAGRG